MSNTDEIVTKKKTPTVKMQNGFMVVGTVVRKVRPANSDGTILLRVAINDKTGTVSYPTIAFYGKEVCDKIDEALVITKESKPRVRIEGYIDSRRKETYSPEGGVVRRNFDWLVGERLGFAETEMEKATGIRGVGTRKAEGMNKFKIVGRVDGIYQTQNHSVTNMVVRTMGGEEISLPRVTCLGKWASYTEKELKRGDVVSVIGYFRTREFHEGERVFHNLALYANDIARIDINE